MVNWVTGSPRSAVTVGLSTPVHAVTRILCMYIRKISQYVPNRLREEEADLWLATKEIDRETLQDASQVWVFGRAFHSQKDS
jgi:hypothetical protein